MRWLTRVRIAPLLAAVIVVSPGSGLVSTVAAQKAGGHQAAGSAHRSSAPAREPTVPRRGAATPFGGVPSFPLPPGARVTQPPRSIRTARRPGVVVPPVFGLYGGVYPYDPGSAVASAPRSNADVYPLPQDRSGFPPQYPQAPPNGWLELPIAPAEAQVYVDGYYVGIISDFSRSGGGVMEAGPHRIEIRAPGYETATFDVRLAPDQTVIYREDLRPLNGVTPPRNAAPARKAPATTTFYVIADCYAGNVPPAEAMLRPGCDPAQVKTVVIQR